MLNFQGEDELEITPLPSSHQWATGNVTSLEPWNRGEETESLGIDIHKLTLTQVCRQNVYDLEAEKTHTNN